MSERTAIWLPCQPPRVTHQSGTRYANRRTFKTKALKLWESQLNGMLNEYRPERPIEGPVMLCVTFGYKAYRKKDIGKWKITKPDTDNSIKTLKDVMTHMGFWKDDAQVVFEVCKKMWVPENPGIAIVIEELAWASEDWRGYEECETE